MAPPPTKGRPTMLPDLLTPLAGEYQFFNLFRIWILFLLVLFELSFEVLQ